MKGKLGISYFYFCLFTFHFLSPAVLLAAEPSALPIDAIGIKWVHIFIRADVNEVSFENIWVFERQAENYPWPVCIDLPDEAVAAGFNGPNGTELVADSGTIRKTMAADSLIDSVGFSFALPNQKGMCRTSITPRYQVNLMVVSVSGPAVELASNILKPNEFMASHSRFSSVYTAAGLAADTKVNIKLSALPRRDCGLLEIACVVGLCLIVIIALITMYYNRKIMKVKSSG